MPKLCGIISDKPKHKIKNSNKIPGFNQPFEDCKLTRLQVDIASLSFHCMLFVFALFLKGLFAFLPFIFHLFVCCCSWLQLPSGTTDTYGGGGGGGGGGGERSRHACSHSFEVFSCLLEIHGNMLSCQKYGFCLKAKNNNKKQQQPRFKKKKLVWELLRISIWTQSLRMCKSHTHTVLFLEGLFACAKDRAKKVFF